MKFDYCQDVLIGHTHKCKDYQHSNCDECNVMKAFEYGLWESRRETLNEVTKFISEETPLSTFMKRNVTDASRSCFELCDKIRTNMSSKWAEVKGFKYKGEKE